MVQSKGVVLIMALVFLLVMTLLVTASLLISQLSHKTALAGQQQLQLSQNALQQHLIQTAVPADATDPAAAVTDCPPQYAGWSTGALRCEVLYLSTEAYSDNRHFYAGYSSIMLKQQLASQVE